MAVEANGTDTTEGGSAAAVFRAEAGFIICGGHTAG